MKGLLVVIVIILVLVIVGWVSFHFSGDKATIEVETGKIKENTGQAVEKGTETLKKAGKELQKRLDDD